MRPQSLKSSLSAINEKEEAEMIVVVCISFTAFFANYNSSEQCV
jgi:hypothetical protein